MKRTSYLLLALRVPQRSRQGSRVLCRLASSLDCQSPGTASFPVFFLVLSSSRIGFIMLLQALRRSLLFALIYTAVASPFPADCGDDSPTRVRRDVRDNLPIAALPAATPLFVAPLPPVLLPLESIASLIGKIYSQISQPVSIDRTAVDVFKPLQVRPTLSRMSTSLPLQVPCSPLLVPEFLTEPLRLSAA